MKTLLEAVCKWSHAVSLRAELWRELRRLRRNEGCEFPGVLRELLWQPTRVDDAILVRRFVTANTPVLLVDVGGNTGYWAEKMMEFMPSMRLIAFEPDTAIYKKYAERFKNNPLVSVHNIGLSDRERTGYLHVAKDSRHSSLDALAPGEEAGVSTVQLSRLDAYDAEIITAKNEGRFAILKIDVQGHELEVLGGAGQSLASFDLIYLECTFATEQHGPTFAGACTELFAHGFHPVLFRDHNRSASPYATECDVIFVRQELSRKIFGY